MTQQQKRPIQIPLVELINATPTPKMPKPYSQTKTTYKFWIKCFNPKTAPNPQKHPPNHPQKQQNITKQPTLTIASCLAPPAAPKTGQPDGMPSSGSRLRRPWELSTSRHAGDPQSQPYERTIFFCLCPPSP